LKACHVLNLIALDYIPIISEMPNGGRRHQVSARLCRGAIAVGHPIGISGARITLHAALELARQGSGDAVAALCGAGGHGDALILPAA